MGRRRYPTSPPVIGHQCGAGRHQQYVRLLGQNLNTGRVFRYGRHFELLCAAAL
ncbi:hypothetical protein NHX12_030527, partial [Muraenolepis orangiensis]